MMLLSRRALSTPISRRLPLALAPLPLARNDLIHSTRLLSTWMAHYELQPSVELPLDDLQARGWDTFRVIVGPAAGPCLAIGSHQQASGKLEARQRGSQTAHPAPYLQTSVLSAIIACAGTITANA